MPCKHLQPPPQQQQQSNNTYNTAGSSSGGSGSGSSSSSSSSMCCCTASLEVVSRPPDGAERAGERLRVNKNLLLLLHHAGVPQHIFAE
jgi:hypothetical protein